MSAATTNNPVKGRRRKPGDPFAAADLTDEQIETLARADAMAAPYSALSNVHTPHHVAIVRDLVFVIRYGWEDAFTPRFVRGCRHMLDTWREHGVTREQAQDWQLIARDLVAIIEQDLEGRSKQ